MGYDKTYIYINSLKAKVLFQIFLKVLPGESEDEPRSHFRSWSSTPNHESLKSSPNKDSQPFSYLQFSQVKNSKNLTEREYFDVRHSKFPRSSLKSHGKSQRHNYETNHDLLMEARKRVKLSNLNMGVVIIAEVLRGTILQSKRKKNHRSPSCITKKR